MYSSVTIYDHGDNVPVGESSKPMERYLVESCSMGCGNFEGVGPNALQQIDAGFYRHNMDQHNGQAHLIFESDVMRPVKEASSISGEFEV